jgi:hypothetical protein
LASALKKLKIWIEFYYYYYYYYTGIFPDKLKFVVVKPLFKKGKTHNVSNYQPIYLLTTFSKVTEKLLYIRLISHIEANNLLIHEQYGFRVHSSTEKAAFSLINNILNVMNNKSHVGAIFHDLHTVFDCVNHKILLDKLVFYEIEGKFKILIELYLTRGCPKVVLGNRIDCNNSSKWELVKCGVPQCLILGPLFFMLY